LVALPALSRGKSVLNFVGQYPKLSLASQLPMSHLWNPLATAQQLEASNADNALPGELQDSIRYSTALLTQAAGILLRLPQDIAAQALVVLMKFWVVEKLMQYEFSVSKTFPFVPRDPAMCSAVL
jgi:hypothetical protein